MASNIIYVLVNEAMPDIVKIGRTRNCIEARIRSLDNTSVPLPFQCFYAAEVSDSVIVESRIHKIFSDKRVRNNREFFRVSPSQVVQAIKLAEIQEITPRIDVITELSDRNALELYGNAEEKRGRVTFKGLQIPSGAILSFVRDESITCVVANNNFNRVIIEEEELSLSAAALKILHNMGYTRSSARGSDYWKYDNQTLTERRLELEEKIL